ncbi:MAG: adenylosuccinate lyase, partial [Pseudomonadales bacterium]
TVIRNIGMALGYCLISYQATLRGLGKLDVNQQKINDDLDQSWEILGEAVQTVMRRHGLENPYERLKAATRGQAFDRAAYEALINDPELPETARASLAALTPDGYTGLAARLTTQYAESRD